MPIQKPPGTYDIDIKGYKFDRTSFHKTEINSCR
jgi:hypothetical protein